MSNEFQERDLDDEVYEDSFYDGEEELPAEDEDDSTFDENDDESGTVKVHVSFACEDCDYRWEDFIIRQRDALEEDDEDIVCPMCGSMYITQI